MGTNNLIFLEVIEWFDQLGKELVHRIPEGGSGEIKYDGLTSWGKSWFTEYPKVGPAKSSTAPR